MSYWLVKSEPGEFSFQDLLKEGKTVWEGVRNFAARNHLRSMKRDDLVLFYHSVDNKEVVGVCKVIKEYFPDPTAKEGDWSAVEIAPVKALNKPVSLGVIKAVPELQNMPLVRIGRLSVMPLEKTEFDRIIELSETTI